MTSYRPCAYEKCRANASLGNPCCENHGKLIFFLLNEVEDQLTEGKSERLCVLHYLGCSENADIGFFGCSTEHTEQYLKIVDAEKTSRRCCLSSCGQRLCVAFAELGCFVCNYHTEIHMRMLHFEKDGHEKERLCAFDGCKNPVRLKRNTCSDVHRNAMIAIFEKEIIKPKNPKLVIVTEKKRQTPRVVVEKKSQKPKVVSANKPPVETPASTPASTPVPTSKACHRCKTSICTPSLM